MRPMEIHHVQDDSAPKEALAFDVSGAKPRLQFQMATKRLGPGWEFFIAHQVAVDGTVRAWTTVDDWWNRADLFLSNEPCQILPEISAAMLRDAPKSMEPIDWLPFFAQQLKGANVLESGRWWLMGSSKHRGRFERINGFPYPQVLTIDQYTGDWIETEAFGEVLPLRRFGPDDGGRVKWWRKVCKAQQLPPIVLMYFGGLESYFIVDGHDRLHACLLEGVRPEFVVLGHVRRQEIQVDPEHRQKVEAAIVKQWEMGKVTPASVDSVNRVLINLYQSGFSVPTSRGYPIRDGVSGWMSGLERASEHYAEEAQDEVFELARWLRGLL